MRILRHFAFVELFKCRVFEEFGGGKSLTDMPEYRLIMEPKLFRNILGKYVDFKMTGDKR